MRLQQVGSFHRICEVFPAWLLNKVLEETAGDSESRSFHKPFRQFIEKKDRSPANELGLQVVGENGKIILDQALHSRNGGRRMPYFQNHCPQSIHKPRTNFLKELRQPPLPEKKKVQMDEKLSSPLPNPPTATNDHPSCETPLLKKSSSSFQEILA